MGTGRKWENTGGRLDKSLARALVRFCYYYNFFVVIFHLRGEQNRQVPPRLHKHRAKRMARGGRVDNVSADTLRFTEAGSPHVISCRLQARR